jgi:hypothetical protein
MARPERNTVDYFPFYCDEGKKMFYIEETYGNDGFAVFIKLLRELAKTEYHYLNLNKNTTLMFMSAKCKVSKDVLIAIINDLVELDKFDKNLWNEHRIIWCQDFIDSIQDAYKKRNNKCMTLDGLRTLLLSLGILKQSNLHLKSDVNTQRKEKDSKEEYIYSKFYDSEIEKSNNNQSYLKIVKTLFGENNLKRKLNGVLKIENQLSFDEFELLLPQSAANKKSIIDMLENMENGKYFKDKISLYKTLLNWTKR